MTRTWVLSQEAFDELLDWLDPNREIAGTRYEEIRVRLIKIFSCRGCYEPEDLADETINRVAKKLPEIRGNFNGSRALYFYGVANKLYLEYLRRKMVQPPIQGVFDSGHQEATFKCLDNCLARLTDENRKLALEYYREERQARIDNRKELARKMGIELSALRLRAHRIRTALQECVEKCLELTGG